MNTTNKLIVSSPYEMPVKHLKYITEIKKFEIKEGRRPAGYVIASESSKSFDDPGVFVELPLVNQIRKRVNEWRASGYPGISSITKMLLDHWKNYAERDFKFYFCQMEAIETLIWLVEGPVHGKENINIPNDGSEFQRLCCKMATGTGKTIVMAMLIAWQILNYVAYKDKRFSKNILVVAPGLTVKSRLQVLEPSNENNYYQQCDIIPSTYFDQLRQGKVKIINWHALSPLDPNDGPRVVKKGEESDKAFVKRVLGDFSDSKNILVINDEAHHAWRTNVKAEGKYERVGEDKDSAEEATIWVSGLDRIHKEMGIAKCHDFSATPFAPSGKRSSEETLFGWIVSDFGLNDAIESGLVKTPHVAIRDDGKLTKDMKSRFYHIYMDPTVKDNINRKAEPHEPLPDLIIRAFTVLGKDWLDHLENWKKAGVQTPPVMITVCNRTETAARIEHAFSRGKIPIDELKNPQKMLRIDSRVLDEAESRDEPAGGVSIEVSARGQTLSKKDEAELLRRKVDTVGKVGDPGEQIQNIIAVAMLSEGWDAKTVTHIMGLRAFSSQLLCEQVVGRGLRRTTYDIDPATGFFRPEHVNIFGVPFTFLPHEGGEDAPPVPPSPKTRVYVDDSKRAHEISWPSIVRINHVLLPKLTLDMKDVRPIELRPEDTPLTVDMAPMLEGKAVVTQLSEIEIESLGKQFRKQRLIFEATRDIFEQVQPNWKGQKEILLMQLVKIVEDFLDSNRLVIKSKYYQEDLRKRVLIMLNMNKIVQHLFNAIRFENAEKVAPVFNKENPIKSTAKMMTWYTSRPCEITQKSHISHVVFDSTWEANEAFEFERNKNVVSWAKNDHLGFVINYVYEGVIHKFYPDFLVKLKNGKMLVLEVKGIDDQKNKTKRKYLDEWVQAVNEDGRFGAWVWDVSFRTSDIKDIILKQSAE